MELCGNHASRICWWGETGCIFARDSGLCDEQKSPFCPSFPLFSKYLFQLELQKISCPRLSQNNACVFQPLLEMCGGGWGKKAWWITAQAQSLTRALPTLYRCLTCWKSLWDWVFSARRAGMEGRGGGEESLTGVSLSWAQRAQQIDPPLPPPPSPPLQHRQTWSTGARPTLSIHPLLPPASNYWRSASKPESNGKHRICCAFKYTCSWPKITPRAAPIVTDHASDCQSSGKVAAFKRSRGCSGERDRRSWPSFLVWSENLCTSALPPPKPKPLLLQAAKGAQCAARQAARFVSEHCPGSPCTHPTPFPSFQAWQCWIYPGGGVWFALLATTEQGWRAGMAGGGEHGKGWSR